MAKDILKKKLTGYSLIYQPLVKLQRTLEPVKKEKDPTLSNIIGPTVLSNIEKSIQQIHFLFNIIEHHSTKCSNRSNINCVDPAMMDDVAPTCWISIIELY